MQQTFITIIFIVIVSLILAYIVVPVDENSAGGAFNIANSRPASMSFAVKQFVKNYLFVQLNVAFMVMVLVAFYHRKR